MGFKHTVAAAMAVLFLSGCTSFWAMDDGYGSRTGASSSLVDYLYPKGEVPPDVETTIPHLQLPLRVGIAFVPGNYAGRSISEATKVGLLEDVKARFLERQFIEHIEVIPDTYLRSSNGIEGMQQVARLYGVDVMALVSYDQVSMIEDNKASLLYWTIVGAYIIQGTDNEVQTFVDTAVFDVNTARLLFRAPGIDKRTDRSTAVESGEVVRKNGEAGFVTAMAGMSANLDAELERFRARAKDDPTVARLEWKPNSGGGSAGWLVVPMLVAVARRRVAKYPSSGRASARLRAA